MDKQETEAAHSARSVSSYSNSRFVPTELRPDTTNTAFLTGTTVPKVSFEANEIAHSASTKTPASNLSGTLVQLGSADGRAKLGW
jgi:hypothetical protein